MFSDIRNVLEQQFSRLSALEREIMYWLAIEREAVSLDELDEDLVHPVSRRAYARSYRIACDDDR